MYMYNMNVPPKKPPFWRKLVGMGYVIAASVAVVMLLVGTFTFGNVLLSLLSCVYGLALVGTVLYKMAKQQNGELIFVQQTVLYALLLLAAVYDIAITLIMPADSLTARIVPVLLVLPDVGISVYQLQKNVRFLR